jgi:hypothetical protein
MKGYLSKQFFDIHVDDRKKISIQQKKMQNREFWKQGLNLVTQKSIVIRWLKLLLQIFSIQFFFPHYVSYIGSLYKILKWNHNKKCIGMLMQNLEYNPHVHFKSSLLYDWCMFIEVTVQ